MAIAVVPVSPASGTGLASRERSALPAPPLLPPPAYFRPVIVDGMAFPVARSNHLSLLHFSNNWHAVRMRLIDGTWRPVGVHEGIDITAEAGTPIIAMAGGVVERTGYLFYSGLRVWVQGDDGRHYLYAHLSSLGPGIAPGARVESGKMLGRMGNTGYGPPGHRDEFPVHLHIGIQAGDRWVNPYPALLSLYRAAVRQDQRSQAEVEALARAGRSGAWRRTVERVYTRFDA